MADIKGVEDEPVYSKIYFDYVKHLSTLATGSIILEVTFLEKVFPHPRWKFFAALSLIAFTLSVISSLALYHLTVTAAGRSVVRSSDDYFGRIVLWLVLLCFLMGITSLTVFGVKNLFTL